MAYLLIWRNGDPSHFWVPFAGHREHGDHEMLPDFRAFAARPDVVLSARMGDGYTDLLPADLPAPAAPPALTLHTPVERERLAGTTTVRVHPRPGVSPDGDAVLAARSVTVRLGDRQAEALPQNVSEFWVAELEVPAAEGLQRLTATAVMAGEDGASLELTTGHDVHVGPATSSDDPLLIDDFSTYDPAGDGRTDVERTWWRTGETMIALWLRSSSDPAGTGTSRAWLDGRDTGTVLRVAYDAVRGQFAQATRSLPDVDWSGATTFHALVQPDGKGYDLRLRLTSLVDGDVRTGEGSTPAARRSVRSFSLRFVQPDGIPEMAGLNAREHYLLDDLRVS